LALRAMTGWSPWAPDMEPALRSIRRWPTGATRTSLEPELVRRDATEE